MTILLSEIWAIEKPEDYKVRFARWNGETQPLEVFVRDRAEWQGLSFAKIHASFRYMHHGSILVAFHCSQTSQADDLRFDCTRRCDQEVIATPCHRF